MTMDHFAAMSLTKPELVPSVLSHSGAANATKEPSTDSEIELHADPAPVRKKSVLDTYKKQ